MNKKRNDRGGDIKDLKKENYISRELFEKTGKTFMSKTAAAKALGVSTDWLSDVFENCEDIKIEHKQKISIFAIEKALLNNQKNSNVKMCHFSSETILKNDFCNYDCILISVSEIMRVFGISRLIAKRMLNEVPFFAICDNGCKSQKKFYLFSEVKNICSSKIAC